MDVVVVGGGIVGVTAALTLAEGDADVVVLERGSIAGEASGLNAGVIGGGGWGDQPDADVVLKMGSRERFLDLAETRGHDIELDLTGTLTLVRSEAEWEFAAEAVEADRRAGRQIELLSGSELAALEPAVDPALLGAIFDPLGARADPVAATRAFATEAERAGASIRTGCAVTGLRSTPAGGWELAVDDGHDPGSTVGADAVIIAAGPWCGDVTAAVGVDLPIVAVRGQMWATRPRPPLFHHAIAAAESLFSWHLDPGPAGGPPNLTHRDGQRVTRHLYGRQRANGEIIFGGDRVLTTDRTIDDGGIAVNHGHAAEMLPALAAEPPARTWAGLMPFSLDGAPVLGPIAEHDGLFVSGGLASSGFGRGPMCGRLIAEVVLGREPSADLAAFSPSRSV